MILITQNLDQAGALPGLNYDVTQSPVDTRIPAQENLLHVHLTHATNMPADLARA